MLHAVPSACLVLSRNCSKCFMCLCFRLLTLHDNWIAGKGSLQRTRGYMQKPAGWLQSLACHCGTTLPLKMKEVLICLKHAKGERKQRKPVKKKVNYSKHVLLAYRRGWNLSEMLSDENQYTSPICQTHSLGMKEKYIRVKCLFEQTFLI